MKANPYGRVTTSSVDCQLDDGRYSVEFKERAGTTVRDGCLGTGPKQSGHEGLFK